MAKDGSLSFNTKTGRMCETLREPVKVLKSLSEKTIKLTLLHEIMHAICGTGQYNDYSNDEPFIEWLANCIYSLKEQGKL